MNSHPICLHLFHTLLCWDSFVTHCYHSLGLVVSSKGPQATALLVPKCTVLAGVGVCSVCAAHVFYIVCQRFTSLSALGLLPGLRELPAPVSFTTAGNFPLRLCFDNLVKGLAFTKCFAVQTHPSLLPRVQHFPKMTMLAHWANLLLVCALAILLVCHLEIHCSHFMGCHSNAHNTVSYLAAFF